MQEVGRECGEGQSPVYRHRIEVFPTCESPTITILANGAPHAPDWAISGTRAGGCSCGSSPAKTEPKVALSESRLPSPTRDSTAPALPAATAAAWNSLISLGLGCSGSLCGLFHFMPSVLRESWPAPPFLQVLNNGDTSPRPAQERISQKFK